MTKICVTGAAGKLGHVAVQEFLEHGYEVVGVDAVAHPPNLPRVWSRPDFVYLRADLEDYGQTLDALAGVEAVVHLANIPAPGLLPPVRTFTANSVMNANVFFAAAQLALRKVVWASSETTLGLNFEEHPPRYVPLDEDHYPIPTSTYALSKVVGEVVAEHVAAWSGIPFLALRLSNVIAETDYSMFPTFWDDFGIRRFNLWSYIDARDAAIACRLALESEVGGARSYIIAAPDTVMTTPSEQLMDAVFPAVPRRSPVTGVQALMSSERARTELGFEPSHLWRDYAPQP